MKGFDVVHDAPGRRFVARVEGRDAFLEYDVVAPDRVDFRYTFTPPALRGRGIARAVVAAALAWARGQGKEVIPSCGYVRAYLERERS